MKFRPGKYIWPIVVVALYVSATSFVGCGDNDDGNPAGPGPQVVEPPDTICPGATTDLHTAAPTSVSFAIVWTSPGDDDDVGTATRYDIRYADQPIDENNWDQATHLDPSRISPPKEGGSIETIVIMELASGSDFWVALKTVDDVGLWSALSNVAVARTKDETIPPSAVTDLAAEAVGETTFELTWTAPGDDYMAGQATSYEIRHAPDPIVDDAAWDAATPLSSAPTPKASGETETFTATGLVSGTSYFFGIRTSDERGNVSDVSNAAPALGFGVDLWISPKMLTQGQKVYIYFRLHTEDTFEIKLFNDDGWFSCTYSNYLVKVLADDTFPPGVHTIVDDFYNKSTREYLPPNYYIVLFCRDTEEFAREWFQIVE